MQWSLGLEHQFGNNGSVKAQYVGTRSVDEPYLTEVNGYQTVCPGCFRPSPTCSQRIPGSQPSRSWQLEVEVTTADCN